MSGSRPRITITLAVLATLALLSNAQMPHGIKPPEPRPSPNTPNPNYPSGLDGPEIKGPDSKTVDKQNQVELRHDIERLYALVFVLREKMKVTDGTSTMSVTIVKQAEQIEKLAKEIKDRAKH